MMQKVADFDPPAEPGRGGEVTDPLATRELSGVLGLAADDMEKPQNVNTQGSETLRSFTTSLSKRSDDDRMNRRKNSAWGLRSNSQSSSMQFKDYVEDDRSRVGVMWAYFVTSTKGMLKTMWKHPHTWVVPLLLLIGMSIGGSFAVLKAADDYEEKERSEAQTVARTAAAAYETDFARSYMPTITLGMIIKENPDFEHVEQKFRGVVESLYETGTLHPHTLNLQIAPNGIPSAIEPSDGHHAALGHNLMFDNRRRGDAINTIVNRDLTLAGPFPTVQGWFAALARYPVFIDDVDADATFNRPGYECPVTQDEPVLPMLFPDGRCVGPHPCADNVDETCGGPFDCAEVGLNVDNACYDTWECTDDAGNNLCYNAATREKFWGFTVAFINFDKVVQESRLSAVSDAGYIYQLHRTSIDLGTDVIASSQVNYTMSGNALVAEIAVPGNTWTLKVEKPNGDWRPTWEKALYGVVVCGAFILSILVCAMLVSRAAHGSLLAAMLPKTVIKQLQQGRRVLKGFGNVTVLFSDIVSYTDMSTRISPLEVSELLDEVYSAFDDITDKYNLYKLDTIGDAFMCVGGCPDTCNAVDAAVRVAKCAQEMINAAAKIKTPEGHAVRIRIGLHSGPVVTGVLGRKVPKYTLYGDTVNTASRMESKGEPQKVHLSHATAYLLLQAQDDAVAVKQRGAVSVKGKGSMQTFWLSPGSQMSQKDIESMRMVCEREIQAHKMHREAAMSSRNGSFTDLRRGSTRFSYEGSHNVAVHVPRISEDKSDMMSSRMSESLIDKQLETHEETHLEAAQTAAAEDVEIDVENPATAP